MKERILGLIFLTTFVIAIFFTNIVCPIDNSYASRGDTITREEMIDISIKPLIVFSGSWILQLILFFIIHDKVLKKLSEVR